MRSDHKVEQREPKIEVGVRPSMPKTPTNRVDRFEIILNHSNLILSRLPFFHEWTIAPAWNTQSCQSVSRMSFKYTCIQTGVIIPYTYNKGLLSAKTD